MLALFRAKQGDKRIFLTSEFHSDLDWFLNFLPSYNVITFIRKAEIPNSQTLHVDASLTGLGGVWNKEVYATPIFNIYGSDLKIVHLEMLNLVIALKLWAQKWALRNIWLILATYDIALRFEHIKGSHNVTADMLSRIYSDKAIDNELYTKIKDTCTWHKIPIQFFNLNHSI